MPQDQQSLLCKERHLEQTDFREQSRFTLTRQSLKALPMAPVFLVVDVTADLLGDSGRIFAEDRSNAFERSPLYRVPTEW